MLNSGPRSVIWEVNREVSSSSMWDSLCCLLSPLSLPPHVYSSGMTFIYQETKKQKVLPSAYTPGNTTQPINTMGPEEGNAWSWTQHLLSYCRPKMGFRWNDGGIWGEKWLEKGVPAMGEGEASLHAGEVYLQVLRSCVEEIKATLNDYELWGEASLVPHSISHTISHVVGFHCMVECELK